MAVDANEAYYKAKACYGELKSDKKMASQPKNWSKCISSFKKVAEDYPKDAKAADSLYSAAKLYRELYAQTKNKTDIEEAIHLYNSVVKDYPENKLADDSLYQIGTLRHDPLKDDERSKRAFEALIERYPEGDMAAKAKESIAAIDAGEELPVVGLKDKDKSEKSSEEKVNCKDDSFRISKLYKSDIDVKDNLTVVTLFTDCPVSFTKKFIDPGRRTKAAAQLTLHFSKTKITDEVLKEKSVASPELRSIRIKQAVFSGGVVVHFELGHGAGYDVTQSGGKVVIRFFPETKRPTAVAATAKSAQLSDKKLRIVLDPGHGGKDTGAIGPGGLQEKKVTLDVSKKLAVVLKKKLNAEVFLTRNVDKDLSLEERNALANSKKADLFISIHVNAAKDKKVSGIETYYLNNASDEAAKRLAERENKSAAKSQNEVDKILLTLFQNYNTELSQSLAENVHKKIISGLTKTYPKLKDRDTRSALFYVLVGAKCPGILLEIAYISNPVEGKRVINPVYQKLLSDAVADGVKKFLTGPQARGV